MFYGQGILPGNLPIYKDKINAISMAALIRSNRLKLLPILPYS